MFTATTAATTTLGNSIQLNGKTTDLPMAVFPFSASSSSTCSTIPNGSTALYTTRSSSRESAAGLQSYADAVTKQDMRVLQDYIRRTLNPLQPIDYRHKKRVQNIGAKPRIEPRSTGTSRIRNMLQAYRLFHWSGTFFDGLTAEEEEMLLDKHQLNDDLRSKLQKVRNMSPEHMELECERVQLERLRQTATASLSQMYSRRLRSSYRENRSSLIRYSYKRHEPIVTDVIRRSYKEYEKLPFELNTGHYKLPSAKSFPPLNKKKEMWVIPLEDYEISPPKCTLKMCMSLQDKPTKCCPLKPSTPRLPLKAYKKKHPPTVTTTTATPSAEATIDPPTPQSEGEEVPPQDQQDTPQDGDNDAPETEGGEEAAAAPQPEGEPTAQAGEEDVPKPGGGQEAAAAPQSTEGDPGQGEPTPTAQGPQGDATGPATGDSAQSESTTTSTTVATTTTTTTTTTTALPTTYNPFLHPTRTRKRRPTFRTFRTRPRKTPFSGPKTTPWFESESLPKDEIEEDEEEDEDEEE